jgi:predicted nucleic acid-binding protein
MADVVLDANVLVGYFDQNDSLHRQALAVMQELKETDDTPVMLDFLVAEAVSVICRRTQQRKTNPPDLGRIVTDVKAILEQGRIDFVTADIESRFSKVLDLVQRSNGALNFHDATLLVLQEEGSIGPVATFDEALARYPGFVAWD